MKAPSLVTVCEWVHDAWQQLYRAIIEKAFLKCKISNALDRTEDDYLWCKPDALVDSIQENSPTREDSENNDPLDSDDDLYDDATNTSAIEEWNKLFEENGSDGENNFKSFE